MPFYAHVVDGSIAVIVPPAPVYSGGRWWDLRAGLHDAALAAGWAEVIETARPADTSTETHDRSVALVGGVPTATWTPRPWTAVELAGREVLANRDAIAQGFVDALATLNSIINYPAAPVVPDGTMNTAQLSSALRQMRDVVQENRQGVQQLAQVTRNLTRYVRGDFT